MAPQKTSVRDDVAKWMDLGWDFYARYNCDELKEIARSLGLNVACRSSRPYKADYVYAIEFHFAAERLYAGISPTTYLHPSFDPSAYTKAYLRQILTQHAIKYDAGDRGRFVAELTRADLLTLFAESLDEMREEAGHFAQREHSPIVDQITQVFGQTTINNGGAGSGAAPRGHDNPGRGAGVTMPRAQNKHTVPYPRPAVRPLPAVARTPDFKEEMRVADLEPPRGDSNDSASPPPGVFDRVHPPPSARSSSAAPVAIGWSSQGSEGSVFGGAQDGHAGTTGGPLPQESTRVQPPATLLSPRRAQRLIASITDILSKAAQHMHETSSLPATITAIDSAISRLEAMLPLNEAKTAYSIPVSSTALGPETIEALNRLLQQAMVTTTNLLLQSKVRDAMEELQVLREDFADEL